MVVSVCMITYNHGRFIAQAIDSVLSQRINFDIEIVIGEDGSPDNTREVCLQYAAKYPDKVKLLLPEKNIGALQNLINVYDACRGKYVALLEGDDYWTDPYKLQKQVDFLEANESYVGCFHNTEERFEDDDKKASGLYCNYPEARDISFADLSYANLIPTCSMLFRRKYVQHIPEWFSILQMGDWPLNLLNTKYGNYWYMPKVMGVHRLHSGGSWMLQDPERNRRFVINAYDEMIRRFADDPTHQQLLITARETFVNPPVVVKPTYFKRGINFIKRKVGKP